jgi:type IV secretion system protein VirB9
MKKIILCLLMVFPLALKAEILPAKGKYDDRIRVVEYNEGQVVRVNTYFGVATLIRFGEGEVIEDKETGDNKAWSIKTRKNYMFLQPTDKHADTNLVVITNKRIYQFALFVEEMNEKDTKAWRNGNLVFSLSFTYPEDAIPKKEVVEAQLEKEKIKTDLVIDNQNQEGMNFDYWVAGAPELSPTSARDNGRFIYLTFAGNKEMPSVHEVNERGEETELKESLIQTTVKGGSIVIEKRVRRIILRKGDLVACVVNKSFDSTDEHDNTTGTSSSSVIRVIKGANE